MESEDFLKRYQYELESRMVEDHHGNMKKSREKGEEDGKRNLPSVDDTFVTPFELETRSKYQAEVEELFQNGRQVLDDLLDGNFKPVEYELNELNDEKIRQLLTEAEKEKTHKLEELNINHLDSIKDIENSPHYQAAKKKFDKVNQRWEEVTHKHNRQELNIHFKPYWAYILLLFAIGIAEFPLNNQVFLSFRETPLLTLIMSGVLVITLPFLAHAAGKFLKQIKERKVYPFILIILVAAVVSISYFTSILRTSYVAEYGAPEAQLALDRWTFFTIGIILFLVGSVASFFAHDDSIEFSEVYHKFHKEENTFQIVQKEVNDKRATEKDDFDRQRKAIQQEYNQKAEGLKNRLQYLKNRKTEIAGNFNKILACYKGLERKINNYCKEAIYSYRDTNLTYRNNHKQPEAWSELVPDLKGYFGQISEIEAHPKPSKS
ncbi:MAG TPA: hypothetical protein VKA38_08755 [Draconibacterium sp.]|nr:hypothetical protein [Draconibacterium sp.]